MGVEGLAVVVQVGQSDSQNADMLDTPLQPEESGMLGDGGSPKR